MAFEPRQTSVGQNIGTAGRLLVDRLEQALERERQQLPLWVPVALGVGIAAWFVLPSRLEWLAFCCTALAAACVGAMLRPGGRMRRMIVAGSLLACIGCLLPWGKATIFGTPPLARAVFVEVTGEVTAVNPVPAQKMSRILLRPLEMPGLPSLIRVNMDTDIVPKGLGEGAVIRFRARLMPPAPPNLPGGYDFARRAYFQGIGATGRGLKPVMVLKPGSPVPPLRARLFAHITEQVEGGGAGIAAALATGDQGAITREDTEAMRRSGLAHLLSISGLHVTALIGAVIFLLMRIMALSGRAALNWPLMLIAAAGGALAGIGYTLLTGAEVPTVRSCVAALLVLAGLALGRDALTLRLVAAGALVVLFLWPEALVGPSFQMSFAAVVALIALSEHPRFRAFAAARDEPPLWRVSRMLIAMLMTGFAVELVLAPIALFHFHKAGMLGAFANLLAIPLTTFVVMPLEALALLFDLVGLGAPFWWLTGRSLDLLLWIAHLVASSPWAVFLAPTLPTAIFGMIVMGGLWCLLWRGRWRWGGLLPVGLGVAVTALASPPDILVTGDGRHVAVRTRDGIAILRERAGSYVRDTLIESAGYDGEIGALAALPGASCSLDMCAVQLERGSGGRPWTMLVTRSSVMVDRDLLARDCARSDIVISDRRLPRDCRPRWLKADRRFLTRSGGLAINLPNGSVHMVRTPGDEHPWVTPLGRGDRGRGPAYRRAGH